MPQCGDAKFFQVLSREARQDLLGYLILAECRLVLPEAQAPQPDHNVHDGAHSALLHIIVRSGESVQEVPKRLDRPFGVNRCQYQNSATPGGCVFGANQCQAMDLGRCQSVSSEHDEPSRCLDYLVRFDQSVKGTAG